MNFVIYLTYTLLTAWLVFVGGVAFAMSSAIGTVRITEVAVIDIVIWLIVNAVPFLLGVYFGVINAKE